MGPPMPDLDFIATAKTTRKTLERLVSFTHMRSSSDPSPLLTKILGKINALVQLIDSSMLAAQFGYQLATDAMIMCDPEETDWEADVTLSGLRDLSVKGYDKSKIVMEGFREIKQEVYKIAASTKDNMLVVIVPPDSNHSETLKIHLKDVGTDLVANLNLLSQFSRAVSDMADWWAWVKDDFASENPALLSVSALEPRAADAPQKFALWLKMQEGFQSYYNEIHVAHVRFPDLLTSSSAAWQAVASARSVSPTSVGHSVSKEGVASPNSETKPGVEGKVGRGKGVRAFVGVLGFRSVKNGGNGGNKEETEKKGKKQGKGGKGKEKERGTNEETGNDISRHRTHRSSSSDSSRSTRSSVSRKSAPAKEESREKEKSRKRPLCSSCRSTSLFGDGVGHLGGHGFMMK